MGTTIDLTVRLARRMTLPDGPDGCWVWVGATNNHGYGRIQYDGRPSMLVHRLAFEQWHGGCPIPDGLVLDHLCRNPPCIRPSHLEPVTQRENIRRGKIATATHCINGHEWNETNTYIRKDTGSRQCKPCSRERDTRRQPGAAKRYVANRRARGKADPSLIPHGTPSGYTHWGCRCLPCKEAAADDRRQRRGGG